MASRFERDDCYAVEGRFLQHIEQVARRLDDPKSLSWDDRRDMANLLNLILSSDVIRTEHN